MIKKYVFFILIVFLSSSCETNFGKYDGYKLDWDDRDRAQYFIILDKGEEVSSTDSKEALMKKSILIKFHDGLHQTDSAYRHKGDQVIESFVVKHNIAFDSTYILVDQKPLDSIRNLPSLEGRFDRLVKALDTSSYHKYWIIKKPTNDIYGPLDKDEYYEERKELGVPETLKIKIE